MADRRDFDAAPPTLETGMSGRQGAGPTAIQSTSLADEIAYRLEAAIVAQELPPGTRLRQEELCERFGVSRTPVREALRKLQAQRLVVFIPNKGATVRIPARQEIEEVYELRAELEGFAAELACNKATPGADAELSRAVEAVRQQKAGPGAGDITDSRLNIDVSGAIRGFHHIIHDTAGNSRLSAVIKELEQSFPGDFCSHEMAQPCESQRLHIDDHLQIRDAIRSRDAARARRLMTEHIRRAKGILLAYLDERRFWGQP